MDSSPRAFLRSLRRLVALTCFFTLPGTVGAAAFTVQEGDVVFGALADPATIKQETPVCFDGATGQIGPCTEAVAGLPEALRVEMCNLYIQLSALKFIAPPSFCDFELLQNDGWVDGATAGFQAGFAAEESAAVTLGPLASPARLHRVYFFFGPDDGNLFDITLSVYQDDGSSDTPGALLYTNDYVIIGVGSYMQVIDLSAANVSLPAGHFRIALTVHHDGAPGVARDDDGIEGGRNWIYTAGSWFPAESLGLTGDWVIRALVEP